MDHIRQALERARALNAGVSAAPALAPQLPDAGNPNCAVNGHSQDIRLDAVRLEASRIVAYDERDSRTKSFDMLRTQVLQSMDQKNWRVLGITSPSPGCGKSVVAANLALSIARQRERSALLVDLDLMNPQIANYLGLDPRNTVESVLEGRSRLADAIVPARIGNSRLSVFPAELSASDSSAWMASREVSAMLQNLKRDYRTHTIIIDLPPMLSSDDVIAVLPNLDCALLVVAVGCSTIAEIEECNRHLGATEVVRIVLNKVPKLKTGYYPYYGARH
jgi:protein-tyrosine kinase